MTDPRQWADFAIVLTIVIGIAWCIWNPPHA